MKRLMMLVAVVAGALLIGLAHAQPAATGKPVVAPPVPSVMRKPAEIPKKIETALPPNGEIPTWNPLPRPPALNEEPEQHSIEARVFHFLQHLFGGPMPREFRSPFANDCGQRPCPYDFRN